LTASSFGRTDAVQLLLSDARVSIALTFIELCAEHGRSEIFNIISNELESQISNQRVRPVYFSALQKAHELGHHAFVVNWLTQDFVCDVEAQARHRDLFTKLAAMCVDVLCVLQRNYRWLFTREFISKLLSTECREGNVNIVQDLLEHHQNGIGDSWTVDDFNSAALRGHMPVLRLLSSARYGGVKKLADNPPSGRICTLKVLGDMQKKNACVMMLCVKNKADSRTMARLVDILRDMVTGELLRWKVRQVPEHEGASFRMVYFGDSPMKRHNLGV
jgi:hypothetical protein